MAITTGNHFVHLSVFRCLPQECRLNQLNFRPFSSALLQLRQNPLQSKGNKIHEKAYLLVPQWWCYTLWDSLKESKLMFICPIAKWPYFMAEIEPSNFHFSCHRTMILYHKYESIYSIWYFTCYFFLSLHSLLIQKYHFMITTLRFHNWFSDRI